MITRRHFLAALGTALSAPASQNLFAQWLNFAAETDGTVGAAALHLGSGEFSSMNGDKRFPLASVCKLPLAMNMLALVDEGKFALDQAIEVLPRDVVSSVSPLAARWPAERSFSLKEMIELMVAQSDNTAVETFFRIGGGAPAMAARFRQWKVTGVRVDRGERQINLDRNGIRHPPATEWTDELISTLYSKAPTDERYRATLRSLRDPRDTGTPAGTVRLLERLFRDEALSKASTAFLIESLKATTTFPTRLKGMLQAGTVVAHKTGTTETIKGLTTATNDSGVIILPNGGLLAVSVYVKASTRDATVRDRVIACISRSAFDQYV
jgi:beta-lactamase class A